MEPVKNLLEPNIFMQTFNLLRDTFTFNLNDKLTYTKENAYVILCICVFCLTLTLLFSYINNDVYSPYVIMYFLNLVFTVMLYILLISIMTARSQISDKKPYLWGAVIVFCFGLIITYLEVSRRMKLEEKERQKQEKKYNQYLPQFDTKNQPTEKPIKQQTKNEQTNPQLISQQYNQPNQQYNQPNNQSSNQDYMDDKSYNLDNYTL